MMIAKVKWDGYPVTMVLHFKSEAARDEFFGQLTDGFGENILDCSWDWEGHGPNEPVDSDLSRVAVELIEEDSGEAAER